MVTTGFWCELNLQCQIVFCFRGSKKPSISNGSFYTKPSISNRTFMCSFLKTFFCHEDSKAQRFHKDLNI